MHLPHAHTIYRILLFMWVAFQLYTGSSNYHLDIITSTNIIVSPLFPDVYHCQGSTKVDEDAHYYLQNLQYQAQWQAKITHIVWHSIENSFVLCVIGRCMILHMHGKYARINSWEKIILASLHKRRWRTDILPKRKPCRILHRVLISSVC